MSIIVNHSTLGKITRSLIYMEHFIYTRKIYTDEGYKVFVIYGV